ncbi:MAG TPA: DDE-type integrase/transposase/recombinase [Candidatus Methylomirabilis sp.]|nr:DDE-type integrase/transposase/recombinase [Candidatus Methylomirabilis sp.]
MTNTPVARGSLWGRFRFGVIGALLSAPPPRGQLQAALRALAAKTWTHPVTGREVQFSAVTIERWYYRARRQQDDPVGGLRRAVRKNCGQVSLPAALAERLRCQYHEHPHWTYQLHYDNLAALCQAEPTLGPLRSYATVRRYLQAHGLVRQPRPQPRQAGEGRAAERRQTREIRSFEMEYVGSLWHLDFHHGSLKVLSPQGQWQQPLALAILDDHSRLCCHAQWYLSETAADLVHGLSQAFQKRGLPRALMTDNGAAMVADEFTQGLLRLGIVHERTLPYSAYQNGKQEAFWGTVEGRLLAMLEGHQELTLAFLNEATQAWVEIEYNRAVHRELACAPVERFAQAADVLRCSPNSDALREAFRLETKRRQRSSDGTLSLEGVRFEVPARFRHCRDVVVRYARWDLSRVDLIDPRHGTLLAPLYPLDRVANADGRRANVAPLTSTDTTTADGPHAGTLPPLLQKILADYSATGLPPAYLPQRTTPQEEGTS